MARFNPGDLVRVNGTEMTLRSWPENDEGFFFATYLDGKGGEVQNTLWVGALDAETGEPIQASASVELVETGGGEKSTIERDFLSEHDPLVNSDLAGLVEIDAAPEDTDPRDSIPDSPIEPALDPDLSTPAVFDDGEHGGLTGDPADRVDLNEHSVLDQEIGTPDEAHPAEEPS